MFIWCLHFIAVYLFTACFCELLFQRWQFRCWIFWTSGFDLKIFISVKYSIVDTERPISYWIISCRFNAEMLHNTRKTMFSPWKLSNLAYKRSEMMWDPDTLYSMQLLIKLCFFIFTVVSDWYQWNEDYFLLKFWFKSNY